MDNEKKLFTSRVVLLRELEQLGEMQKARKSPMKSTVKSFRKETGCI